jgi:hypothetical protein
MLVAGIGMGVPVGFQIQRGSVLQCQNRAAQCYNDFMDMKRANDSLNASFNSLCGSFNRVMHVAYRTAPEKEPTPLECK